MTKSATKGTGKITLTASRRDRAGKGGARETRRGGNMPAVLYGGSAAPELIALNQNQMNIQSERAGFFTHIIELDLDGKSQRVLVRDLQRDPVTDRPVHADFLRVLPGTKIRVDIPIVVTGQTKCPGVKRGGVVNIVRHVLTARVPVDAIPEKIEISVEGLDIGGAVHLSSLKLPENVRPLTGGEDDLTLVTIAVPTTVKAEEDKPAALSTEGAAPAAGAAAPAAADAGKDKAKK